MKKGLLLIVHCSLLIVHWLVMKSNYRFVSILLLCGAILLSTGCGRKGDPIIPVVPQPLPAQNVSAELDNNAILLSWTLPSEYDTGKPMALKDIKTITVFRKIESSKTDAWDFRQTSEGWTVAGNTFPIKWHKEILRTASKQKNVSLISPPNLSIQADNTRYIRFKLWSKNSHRGVIAFITKEDTRWDTDVDLAFRPAVYTSFYTYQQVFNQIKLKPFQIISTDEETAENVVYEYVIDMGKVPAWKGKIIQIGIILDNADSDQTLVEMGLKSFEVTNTLQTTASVYESAPWLFLEDEEGWRTNRLDTVFGASEGVLYANDSEAVMLMSPPNQNIKLNDIRQIQLRMQVTGGDHASLLFRPNQGESLQPLSGTGDGAPNTVQFPLQDPSEFHTYTLDVPEDLAKTLRSGDDGKSKMISQIGLFFPALSGNADRRILIDYIAMLGFAMEPGILFPFLAQKDIPAIDDIDQQVRQKASAADPEFRMPYPELPSKSERVDDKPLKLAEISPDDPAPAMLKENLWYLTDTGEVSKGTSTGAIFHEGERYTYTIEVMDRKKHKSQQPGSVAVEFVRIPTAPYNLQARPGDGEVFLTWQRPFLTTDGKKIKTLTGYNIFRSTEAGQYSTLPIYRASPDEITYIDANLTNGITYYYMIQSIGTTTPVIHSRDFSPEVSAIPINNIPPATPTGLVGVYMDKAVNLYWNAVQVKDFAGFHLYRSEDPAKGFSRINATPIRQSSYKDKSVEAQKTYYYYVTAIDNAVPPNESQPSEQAVVETVILE